jgi:hypothetical protein
MSTTPPISVANSATEVETEFLRRYPGTRPFKDNEAERVIFTGREAEIAELVRSVISNRLFVLYSKSGIGKTSLLNAGLFPELRARGYAPLSVRFEPANSADAPAIVAKLVHDIAAHAREQKISVHDMPAAPTSFAEVFSQVTFWGENGLMHPVLVLDQFEEVFRLFPRPSRAHIARQLSGLLGGTREELPTEQVSPPPPGIRVLISQRDDFLGQLLTLRRWLPDLLTHSTRLQALTSRQALVAITRPARLELGADHTPPFHYSHQLLRSLIRYLKSVDNDLREKSLISDAETVESFVLQVFCEHIENRVIDARRKKQPLSKTIPSRLDSAFLSFPKTMPSVLRGFYRRKITSTVVVTLADRITPKAETSEPAAPAAKKTASRPPSTFVELTPYIADLPISSGRKALIHLFLPFHLIGAGVFFYRCLWLIEKDLIDRDGGRRWKREAAIKSDRKLTDTELQRLEHNRLLLKADDDNYQLSHDKLARAIHQNSLVRKLEVCGKTLAVLAIIAFLSWLSWDQYTQAEKDRQQLVTEKQNLKIQTDLKIEAQEKENEAIKNKDEAIKNKGLADLAAQTAKKAQDTAENAAAELLAMQKASNKLYRKLAETETDTLQATEHWASAVRAVPEDQDALRELIGAVMQVEVTVPQGLFVEPKLSATKPRLHQEIYNTDTRYVATHTKDGIQSWDVESGKKVALFTHGSDDGIDSEAWLTAEGKQLVLLHPQSKTKSQQEQVTLEWRAADNSPPKKLVIPVADKKAYVELAEVSSRGRWVSLRQNESLYFIDRDGTEKPHLTTYILPDGGISFTAPPASAEKKSASPPSFPKNYYDQSNTTSDAVSHYIFAPDDSMVIIQDSTTKRIELRIYRDLKSHTLLANGGRPITAANLQFTPKGDALLIHTPGAYSDPIEIRPVAALSAPGKRVPSLSKGLFAETSLAEFSPNSDKWLALAMPLTESGVVGSLWDKASLEAGHPITLWSGSDGGSVASKKEWMPNYTTAPHLTEDGRFCISDAFTGTSLVDGLRILNDVLPTMPDGADLLLRSGKKFPSIFQVNPDHTLTHYLGAPAKLAREDSLLPGANMHLDHGSRHLLSATSDGRLAIWKITQNGLEKAGTLKTHSQTMPAGFSHNQFLATVRESSSDNVPAHAAIYDIHSGEQTFFLREQDVDDSNIIGDPVCVQSSKDGKRMIILTESVVAHCTQISTTGTFAFVVEEHDGLSVAADISQAKLYQVHKDGSIWQRSWAELLEPVSTPLPQNQTSAWTQILPPPPIEGTHSPELAPEANPQAFQLSTTEILHFAYAESGRLELFIDSDAREQPSTLFRATLLPDGKWVWLPWHQFKSDINIESVALTDDGKKAALLSSHRSLGYDDKYLQLFELPDDNRQAKPVTPPIFNHPNINLESLRTSDGLTGSFPDHQSDEYKGPLPFTPAGLLQTNDLDNHVGTAFLPGTEEVLAITEFGGFRVDLGAWRMGEWSKEHSLRFVQFVNDLLRSNWAETGESRTGWIDPGSVLALNALAQGRDDKTPPPPLMKKLVEWLLTPFGEGTISPASRTTFTEWAKSSAEARTPESVSQALAADPFNALALAWHAYFAAQDLTSTFKLSEHACLCSHFHYARQYATAQPDVMGEILMLEAVTMLEMGDYPRAQKASDAFQPPAGAGGHWPSWAKVIDEVKTAIKNSKLKPKDPKRYNPRLELSTNSQDNLIPPPLPPPVRPRNSTR